ncbi:MAG: nuclear transport factor 2 family protein [Burkholderiales bacterium]|nr:nuclear transport factor 2 family protein [Burkholderiales bacterium]
MYHWIVRRKLRQAFRDINAGRYERIVPQFSARPRHAMHGDHALGGERRTLASTTAWYARLQRLLPDLAFEVRAIAVTGWPWRTLATVTWDDRFTLPDGTPASNHGVHEFELRWGRVHSLVVHCDTARLQGYCARMVASGVSEAGAPPITDAALSPSCP